MRGRSLVILVVIIIAFYFLNPDYQKHCEKLGITAEKAMVRNPSINRDSSNSIMGERFEYNDYYIFSTLTDNLTGKSQSFGILGFVFKQ